MKVLVTGATGFLGRHLVDALLGRGHEVVAIARDLRRLPARDGLTWAKGDVLDGDSVRRAAEGCGAVHHAAGKVSRDADDADAMWQVHVSGTRAVLEACRAAGVTRAVVASTSGTVAISEDRDHVGREDDPTPYALIQRFAYYRSKLYAEHEALAQHRDGLDVVVVNPTLLLGPGDVHRSSTGDVQRFLDGRVPAVPSGGVAFVDARDAAEAMALAQERGRGGRRYLINAANWTLREFFDRLGRLSGVKSPALTMPPSRTLARLSAGLLERAAKWTGTEPLVDATSAEMAQLYWYADATRARTELGWSPRDPMDTLADTIKDLRAAQDVPPVRVGA